MLTFSIDIEPKPAPRPRVSKYGNVYIDDWYKEYKTRIQYQAEKYTCHYTTHDPLILDVTFRKNTKVTQKRYGDLDNLLKGVMDALIGYAYHDDAQIIEVHGHKVQSADEGIDVCINYL